MEQTGGELGGGWGMFQAKDSGNLCGKSLEGTDIIAVSAGQSQYTYKSQQKEHRKFVHPFNEYLLNADYVPDMVPCISK